MKKIYLLLLVPLALLLNACSNNGVPVPTSLDGANVAAFSLKPDSLLSTQTVAEIVGVTAAQLTVRLHASGVPYAGILATYSWESGETEMVATPDGKEEIAIHYSAAIGLIEEITEQDFEVRFGSVNGLRAEAKTLAANNNVAGSTAAAELRYLNDYAKTLRYEEVRNVGKKAYWVLPAQALHVFADGVTFTVIGNSGSEEQSKEQAMALAGAILSNDGKKT